MRFKMTSIALKLTPEISENVQLLLFFRRKERIYLLRNKQPGLISLLTQMKTKNRYMNEKHAVKTVSYNFS